MAITAVTLVAIMKIRPCLFLIAALLLQSCSAEEGPANFDATQLTRLLAGDSAKTWTLMSRLQGPDLATCDQDDQFKFRISTSTEDTLTVNFETGSLLCPGQIDSVLFQGTWSIDDGILLDSLVIAISGDTSRRSIDFITSQQLTLTHLEQGQTISDTYLSNQ